MMTGGLRGFRSSAVKKRPSMQTYADRFERPRRHCARVGHRRVHRDGLLEAVRQRPVREIVVGQVADGANAGHSGNRFQSALQLCPEGVERLALTRQESPYER